MLNVTKCYAQTQNFPAFEKLVDEKCQWIIIKSPSSGIQNFIPCQLIHFAGRVSYTPDLSIQP